MRAAAFSLVEIRALRGRAQHHVAQLGERRRRVIGDGDDAGAIGARDLDRIDHARRAPGMREGDDDVARAQQRRRHRHHMRVVEHGRADADAQELVGDVARDLRRAAEAVEVALMGAVQQLGRHGSNASMSRIASVSSSAWIEVRKTFWTIVSGGVVGRHVLVQIDMRLALIGLQAPRADPCSR